MKRALASAVALGLVAVAALGVWISRGLNQAADPTGATVLFEVRAGEPLHGVTARLADAGLLRRRALTGPRQLVWLARLRGVDRDIKSGEYELSAAMSPVDILDKLVSGAVKTWPVTLPEGLRLDEIAVRLEGADIIDAKTFLAHARDAEQARTLGVEADTLEGYLYPETYRFRRGSSPTEVLERMHREGTARTEAGRAVRVVDLPGAYSLAPRSSFWLSR